MNQFLKGFARIELLIVVAIIAILEANALLFWFRRVVGLEQREPLVSRSFLSKESVWYSQQRSQPSMGELRVRPLRL